MFRFLILLLFLAEAGLAQQRYTANTLTLGGESPGEADIEIMSWLAGHWQGEAFGGIGEEWWSSPREGAMMGIYRANSPRFNFYEILTIYEQEGSLLLRLKHFNRDLTGWEEKGETIDFPFIRAEEMRIYFNGWTFERLGPDRFKIFLALENEEGEVTETVFLYDRVSQ